jgi:hypothetical protein
VSNTAQAKLPLLKKTHAFGDWSLYNSVVGSEKQCYATAQPYRTKSFVGIRETPWLSVRFVGYNKFTVSASAGFTINHKSGFVIESDAGDKISLLTLQNGRIWSYSNKQDMHLINMLMRGDKYFTTRSYAYNDQTALDYYSLEGFNEVLKYMNKNC